MTVSILLSIRNNIITLLNVRSIEKVNERSSSCYKTSQRPKLFCATHNRMVNDNDIKKSYLIFAKNIQVDSILLRLSIEGARLFSNSWAIWLDVLPTNLFEKPICRPDGKTFFVRQYKANGMAEIFCKNVVKGYNQSHDVLLVDIWKLQ